MKGSALPHLELGAVAEEEHHVTRGTERPGHITTTQYRRAQDEIPHITVPGEGGMIRSEGRKSRLM